MSTKLKGLGFVEYIHNGKKRTAHRTLLKIIINPVLRFIQFYTDRPWVIASNVDLENRIFLGYIFTKVRKF